MREFLIKILSPQNGGGVRAFFARPNLLWHGILRGCAGSEIVFFKQSFIKKFKSRFKSKKKFTDEVQHYYPWFFRKRFALDRIYTVNTVSRLLGKTKQNLNVEKKLKRKLQGTFSLFYIVFQSSASCLNMT